MAGAVSVASGEGAMGFIPNPAATGALQRTTLDLGYAALAGPGKDSGLGHALNLGLALPQAYGVWNAQLGFVHSPFDDLGWGTVFTGRVGMSKALYPDLLVGLAVDLAVGNTDKTTWGLNADLGIQGELGTVGFMQDFRWGAALKNLGTSYAPSGTAGILGSAQATGMDSPYTLAVGAAASFLEVPKAGLTLGGALDLGFPTFQNAVMNLGLKLSWKDTLELRSSWDLNLREAMAGVNQGLAPSLGLGGRIRLKGSSDSGKAVFKPGTEIHPSFGAYQLPSGIWAFSLGSSIAFGAVDAVPPAIEVLLPGSGSEISYISPNGDGVQDSLVVPVRITDSRYIQEYVLTIKDASGVTVRRIQDRESWPSGGGFREVSRRFLYSLKDVKIPGELVWDGRNDSGGIVPDGLYSFMIEATDDNGNLARTQEFQVVVDNTKPLAKAAAPVRRAPLIFSPDGNGEKDDFPISLETSLEDTWLASIKDAGGTSLRKWEFSGSAPATLVWDGRDTEGTIVPDGLYSFSIQSTDRAGNTGQTGIEAIVVNTQRAPIGVSVKQGAFSPNGDGVLDFISIDPYVPIRAAIYTWTLAVVDAAGRVMWTAKGEGLEGFQDQFDFNGKDSTGKTLPEGRYRARLTVVYDNGHNPESWSAPFELDITPPAISATVLPGPTGHTGSDALIFSPDGDGSKDSLAISQTGSVESLWLAEIVDAAGTSVRFWEFRSVAPGNLVWDGRNQAGTLVPDGIYSYTIQAEDRAGNKGIARIDRITVDTRRPTVGLKAEGPAFSPNGDGVLDTLGLVPQLQDPAGLSGWTLTVVDETGRTVWTQEGSGADGVPVKFAFQGRGSTGNVLPEGRYKAGLNLRYRHGYQPEAWSEPFVIDVTPPAITLAGPTGPHALIFSPDGDGSKDSLAISQKGSVEELWTAAVLDQAGRPVRTWETRNAAPEDLQWDGKTDDGLAAPDGRYVYRISATDLAGNKTTAQLEGILLDTRKPAVAIAVDPAAFSPNADGVKDTLALNIEVPSKADLVSWTIAVVDAAGKDAWTLTGTGGAALQDRFEFDGKDRSGRLLPEGTYLARIAVGYTNGHAATARSGTFTLDNTAPVATLRVDQTAFNPLGEVRPSVIISQTGSEEELWLGSILDRAGKPVRTWRFSGRPEPSVRWDGFDDTGTVVPDGTYTYRLSSTDRAGNSATLTTPALVVNTEAKEVRLALDRRAFSPNGDGINDILTLGPTSAASNISQWRLEIRNAGGSVVRTFSGRSPLPPSVVWDGKNDRNAAVPDGSYQARIFVDYTTGEQQTASSVDITLDTKAPVIRLSAEDRLFSPNGDGRKDSLRIVQDSDPGDNWEGRIVDARNQSVRSWTWNDRAVNFEWNGTDTQGRTVADGVYRYIVQSVDAAGNRTERTIDGITVDNRPTSLSVAVSGTSFNPAGTGTAARFLTITPTVQLRQGIEAWRLELVDQGGTVRKTFRGTGSTAIPATFTWDGKADNGTIVEGNYTARLSVDYLKGDRPQASSSAFVVFVRVPAIRLSAEDKVFSPNGDGRKDSVRFTQDSDPGDTWEGRILDDQNRTVRSWTWRDKAVNFQWDGTDAQNRPVPDGRYRYLVWADDAAGNRVERSIDGIVVDRRPTPVTVTANARGFSPNGDGNADVLPLTLGLAVRDGIETWRLELIDQDGTARRRFGGPGSAAIPASLDWDGRADNGSVVQSRYTALLTVDYVKGDRSQARSTEFILDSQGPRVAVNVTPQPFSPDDDGVDDELRIAISVSDSSGIDSWLFEIIELAVVEGSGPARERVFFSWRGRGSVPERLSWNGRSPQGELVEAATDYLYRFQTTDEWANSTKAEGIIAVDVLVMREGDRLKIKVPSIVFRANFADFNALPQETLDRNNQVLRRIAQILNRYPGYRIQIEGHANSIAKMTGASQAAITREEQTELLPLSAARAELVRRQLVEFGVEARRLSVMGRGSSEPVVPFTDAENRWKNRRVEFILIRQ
jgi:flagellar hook assembly protein FlgD/outer membrane protein OmpA-like peptidoglycan-associated protein